MCYPPLQSCALPYWSPLSIDNPSSYINELYTANMNYFGGGNGWVVIISILYIAYIIMVVLFLYGFYVWVICVGCL